MSEHPYHLKCKWAIASHARAIITVSILLCVLTSLIVLTGFVTPASAYSPATYFADDEPTAPEITHSVDQTQEVSTTVDNSTFAYTEGERLSNTDTYPLDAVSNMQLTASAVGTESTLSEHRLLLTYEATVGGEDSPFWAETTTLDETTPDEYEEGETVSLESTVDINQVHNQIQKYDEELGRDSSVNVYTTIETDYVYESSESRISDDDPVTASATATHKQEIEFGDSIFTIPTSGDTSSTTTGGTNQSTNSGGGLTNIASVFIFLISGTSAGICYRHQDDYDVETLEMKIEELQNQDWITVVNKFDSAEATSTSAVSALKDLINLAIDKGDRVVYCYDRRVFIFVDNGTEYIYNPPQPPLITENIDVTKLEDPTIKNRDSTSENGGLSIWEDTDSTTDKPPQSNGDAQPNRDVQSNGSNQPDNHKQTPSNGASLEPENPTADAIDEVWIGK